MNRSTVSRTMCLGVLAIFNWSPAANAQPPGQPIQRQPAFSPYLNLTRPGSAVNNYFGLVRPEVEFRRSIGGLQQQVGAMEQSSNAPTTQETPFPATGHPAGFMNYSHYFSLRPGRSNIGGPGSFGVANPTGPGSFAYPNTYGPGSFASGGGNFSPAIRRW